MSKIGIGIDLGTTYSCVGVFQHGKVDIIANEMGNRTTPSYIAFNDSERLIGEAAKNQVAINPKNTVFDAKRLIGRRFDDEKIQADMKHWPFRVYNDCGKPKIEVEFKGEVKRFAPEEVSSMVLTKMREIAETYLGKKTNDAVITVPAYFNDSQRQATKDAGSIAGLNVLRIINEPTAAALAYGLDKNLKGIAPAPRGVPKIEVTFDLDANGILNVSAKDNSTGKQEKITIKNDKGRLSKAEIDRMLNDAEKYREEDEKQQKRIQARNQLESYIFGCKQAVEDAPAGKLTDNDKKTVHDKCTSELSWLDCNTLAEKEEFEDHLKETQKVCSPIMAKIHSSGQQQQQQGGKPTVEEVD